MLTSGTHATEVSKDSDLMVISIKLTGTVKKPTPSINSMAVTFTDAGAVMTN